MSVSLRILLIVVSVLGLVYMLKKIRQSKLQIEYAVFWIICSVCFVIIAVFPQIVYWLANLFDIISPANAVFLCIIAILLIKVFMLTVELSQLENKVKELVQVIALYDKEYKEKHNNKE
jgi:hypothetical protein